MRRRKMSKVKFNKRLVIDALGASLIVQKLPALLEAVTGVDLTAGTKAPLVGAGLGYLSGMFLKRPDISNVAIALAISDFAGGWVDQALTGVTGTPVIQTSTTPTMIKSTKVLPAMSDYGTLNDYTNSPSYRMSVHQYSEAYK